MENDIRDNRSHFPTMKHHICVSFISKIYELYVRLAYSNNKSLMLLLATHMLASLASKNTPSWMLFSNLRLDSNLKIDFTNEVDIFS